MLIKLTSVFVDNQDKALIFYTEKLGFIKKHDFSVGEFKWLTVVSPEDPEGTELLLEPDINPISKTYNEALQAQNIPAISFEVVDVQKEFERLIELDVKFSTEPTNVGTAIVALFDDTCGNFVQIYQPITSN